MSCPNETGCELRKIGSSEDQAICLGCGCLFKIEKIDPSSPVNGILLAFLVAAILFNFVTEPKQLPSSPYLAQPAAAKVNRLNPAK